MKLFKLASVSLIAGVAAIGVNMSASAQVTLDQVLNAVRQERRDVSAENRQRIERFRSERNQQQSLLNQVRNQVAAAEAELEDSESEFFQDTARQIAELVEVEHTEHLPASRVLERNKRLSTAQHGKSMALECLASTPVSASPSRRRLSWDKALGATGEAVATVSFGSPTKSRVR